MISVVISPLSFLISFIWVLSLFFLMSILKGLSSLFIFSKNQLLDLLIFWIVLLVPMSFNYSRILVISFLLFTLGIVCCCSFSLIDVGVGCLFELFLSFLGIETVYLSFPQFCFGGWFRLQHSQVSSLQPKTSECCVAPTDHRPVPFIHLIVPHFD